MSELSKTATDYNLIMIELTNCCNLDRGVNVVGRIQKNTMDEIMKGKAWKAFIDEFDCNRCSMNQFHFAFKE